MPFQLVPQFNHDILGIQPREKGLLNEAELAISLNSLKEEIDELEEAHIVQDYIGAIDAVMDLMYFSIGVLYKMGLTPHEMNLCFDAVHHCNMTKRRGVNAKRGDGSAADAVKPEDWVGPEERIAAIIGGV